MSKKYHVQRREFLNRLVEMPAYAIAVVEDTREIAIADVDSWKWGEIKLMFSDCYRNISFEFDLSSIAERENSLHKIRLIAEVVNAFKEALEIEAASVEERLCLCRWPRRQPRSNDLPRRTRPSCREGGRHG